MPHLVRRAALPAMICLMAALVVVLLVVLTILAQWAWEQAVAAVGAPLAAILSTALVLWLMWRLATAIGRRLRELE